jgi:hypothetical protein
LLAISKEAIGRLNAAIQSSSFQSLPTSLAPDPVVTDEDVFMITVWNGHSQKRVGASGFDRLNDKGAAKRFQLVWAAVDEIVPEPKRWNR